MNAKPLRTREYLEHVLDAIERIDIHTTDFDFPAFDADARTQDAVIRNLEVVGEAARNVLRHDPAFVIVHANVPWRKAYQMRNVLSHGYAEVDLEVVWRTLRSSLPPLKM